MSQEELAQQIGLNRGNIASYENGTAEPKICNLLKLSRILGVSILDLTMKNLQSGDHHLETPAINGHRYFPDSEQIDLFVEKANMLEDYLEGLYKCYAYKKAKFSDTDLPEDVNFIFDFFDQAYDAAQNLLEEHKQLIDFVRCPGK